MNMLKAFSLAAILTLTLDFGLYQVAARTQPWIGGYYDTEQWACVYWIAGMPIIIPC